MNSNPTPSEIARNHEEKETRGGHMKGEADQGFETERNEQALQCVIVNAAQPYHKRDGDETESANSDLDKKLQRIRMHERLEPEWMEIGRAHV